MKKIGLSSVRYVGGADVEQRDEHAAAERVRLGQTCRLSRSTRTGGCTAGCERGGLQWRIVRQRRHEVDEKLRMLATRRRSIHVYTVRVAPPAARGPAQGAPRPVRRGYAGKHPTTPLSETAWAGGATAAAGRAPPSPHPPHHTPFHHSTRDRCRWARPGRPPGRESHRPAPASQPTRPADPDHPPSLIGGLVDTRGDHVRGVGRDCGHGGARAREPRGSLDPTASVCTGQRSGSRPMPPSLVAESELSRGELLPSSAAGPLSKRSTRGAADPCSDAARRV